VSLTTGRNARSVPRPGTLDGPEPRGV
jgi:hypothetical protein